MFDDETIDNVASNVCRYYKKLVNGGLPSDVAEHIVRDYHEMILATLVFEPPMDDDTVLSA